MPVLSLKCLLNIMFYFSELILPSLLTKRMLELEMGVNLKFFKLEKDPTGEDLEKVYHS